MKYKTITLCTALLVIACCWVSSEAQEDQDHYGRWTNGITEPWMFDGTAYTKDEAAAFQHRWKAIGSQASRTEGNEWVGDYVRGDLHKTYFRWSPGLGFAYAYVFTCSTGVLGINYGSVEASPAALVLRPALVTTAAGPNGSHGGHGAYLLPRKYLPVKWGEQHYLVEEGKVATFYKFVAGIGEYQSGGGEEFFVKTDDYGKSPDGMPVIPPGYERFIKRPIEAKIRAVGAQYLKRVRTMDGTSYYESINPVSLDVGRADGVSEGMALYVVGSKFFERIEITRVGTHRSKGFIERFVDDNNQENHFNNDSRLWEKYPLIKEGWELTTSAPLNKQF